MMMLVPLPGENGDASEADHCPLVYLSFACEGGRSTADERPGGADADDGG